MQCSKKFKKSKNMLIFILMRDKRKKKWCTYTDDIAIWMLYKYGVCIDINKFLIYCTVPMAIYIRLGNVWHCPYFSKDYDQLTIYTWIMWTIYLILVVLRWWIWVLFELCGGISVLYLVFIISLNYFFLSVFKII